MINLTNFLSWLSFILTFLAVLIAFYSGIRRRYKFALENLLNMESEFRDLDSSLKSAQQRRVDKEKDVERIHNIYEVAKEMCEFLDEDKIFESFEEGLAKFAQFEECKFLNSSDSEEAGQIKDFQKFPLISETTCYGYLAIKGLKKQDKSTLDILFTQLVTNIKRVKLYERVQELAITDSLTRIFTRKYASERYEEEFSRSQEFNLPLSLMMIDIDNFKSYNDKYGHLVGDVILKTIADIIKTNCREIDLIARYGGEEFMVVMPMTPKDGAIFAAERIRRSVESGRIKAFDESLKVTISIGIANYPHDAKSSQELFDKSDWALYRSKRTGKNKVSAFALYK